MKKTALLLASVLLAIPFATQAKTSFYATVIDLGYDTNADGVLKVRKDNGNYVVVHHSQQDESRLWNNDAITVSQVLLTKIYNNKEQYMDKSWLFTCDDYTTEAEWVGFEGLYTQYQDCIFDF